jgi:TPR repeat protein
MTIRKAVALIGLTLTLVGTDVATAFAATAPFAIFNDNGGDRDRFQHLLFLAEHGRDARDRGRKYRNLGAVLSKAGRGKEALRAYEAGALEGDGTSAGIVVDAFLARRYKPQQLGALAAAAILPRAESGNISSALLLSELLSTGRIKGASFRTSGYWLDKAAKSGSGTAQRMLAESAERRGDIRTAANYYAALDKTGSRLARALRQAKHYYLGEEVRQNVDLGLAWLNYASALDATAAGKLASKLTRQAPGSDGEEALYAMARSAGIVETVKQGTGVQTLGPSARLAAATTDAERETVLAALKSEADSGALDSAIVYWRALAVSGAAVDVQAPYLLVAVKAGNVKAINAAAKLLIITSTPGPDTDALVAAITTAADAGNVDALLALAALYATGGPVVPDETKSLNYYRAAADHGDADSQLRVGVYFAQDTTNDETLDLARQYLAAAAAQGSVPAQAYLDALPV